MLFSKKNLYICKVNKTLTILNVKIMKKFFALAAMFAAVAMVSCGGQQKAAEAAEEAQACCAECVEAAEECCGECAEECEAAEECTECCGECAEAEVEVAEVVAE